MNVRVETLDRMVEKYGQPRFIKIDVEGFELEVLRGLATPVAGVSFEFTGEMNEETISCVQRCQQLGMNWFNLSFGESMGWSSPAWQSADEICNRLEALRGDRQLFGDVYAFQTIPDEQTADVGVSFSDSRSGARAA